MQNRASVFIRAACGFALAAASPLFAQNRPPSIIRTDTVWRGQVEIDRDVSIIGAEVRVEAGTTIRFAGPAAGKGPRILLASRLFESGGTTRVARLVLAGTVDRPVIVETAEGHASGAIEAETATTSSLDARYTTFRRLGGRADEQACSPAILVQLAAADNDLWLTLCRFESCGPVRAEMIGRRSSAEIAGCDFVDTCGSTALSLAGAGEGIKVVRDNVADAAFEIATPQCLVTGNAVVGEQGSIAIRSMAASGVAVRGNYVHCTTKQDIGKYALRCEAPAAIVEDNVLVGGSYVLETAPRTVRGNVLIGAADLRARIGVATGDQELPEIQTMTHSLISHVPPDAELIGNLLLGPAYGSVTISERYGPMRIAENIFDGWGVARRAVAFDLTATGDGPVVVRENVFADFTQVPIVSESPAEVKPQVGDNIFVGREGPAYEGFPSIDNAASGDKRAERFSDALATGRGSPATQAAVDVDERILSRRMQPADVHKLWFEIYRPRP